MECECIRVSLTHGKFLDEAFLRNKLPAIQEMQSPRSSETQWDNGACSAVDSRLSGPVRALGGFNVAGEGGEGVTL